MINLKDARKRLAIDEFIKQHDSDSIGDLDKLDAAIKRPVQETGKADQEASKKAPADD